jgi:hypothetical protein
VSHDQDMRRLCRQRAANWNREKKRGGSCHTGLEKSSSYIGPDSLVFTIVLSAQLPCARACYVQNGPML